MQKKFDRLCSLMRAQGRLGDRVLVSPGGLCCAAGVFIPPEERHLAEFESLRYERPDGTWWNADNALLTPEGILECMALHDEWPDRGDVEGFLKAVAGVNNVRYETATV